MTRLGRLRLVLQLALRERAARTRSTLLGTYGALLLPLVESSVYALVFGLLVRVHTLPGPYLLFVYVGLLAWRSFARGVTAAVGSLSWSPSLFQGVTAAVVAALFDGVLGLPALAVLLAAFGRRLALGHVAVWLPVGFALQLCVTLGLGYLLAALSVLYRSVGPALGPTLNLLMFLAPVIYSSWLVPRSLQPLFLANPMAAAIESYRAGLLGAVPVPAASLGAAAAVAALSLFVGVAALRRRDNMRPRSE